MNDPYMIHANRRDVQSMVLHPGRPPRNFHPACGRTVVPYAPSVRISPPYPKTDAMLPVPSAGTSTSSSSMMADSTFDLNSTDREMRNTVATMVRRMGGTVTDTTPED